MLTLFAAVDPQTTLTSGNAVAILALIIVTLAGVVVFLAKKLFDNQRDSAAEIKELNKLIYQIQISHTSDYRQMAEKDQTALLGIAHSQELLSGKIEAVKGGQ